MSQSNQSVTATEIFLTVGDEDEKEKEEEGKNAEEEKNEEKDEKNIIKDESSTVGNLLVMF